MEREEEEEEEERATPEAKPRAGVIKLSEFTEGKCVIKLWKRFSKGAGEGSGRELLILSLRRQNERGRNRKGLAAGAKEVSASTIMVTDSRILH